MTELDPLIITIGMFGTMFLMLMMGAPLAWSLLTVGLGFAYTLWGPGAIELLTLSSFAALDNFLLVALPMFIFMGLMLERSGITDDLFEMMNKLMGQTPGGLGVGTVIAGPTVAVLGGCLWAIDRARRNP